MYTPNVHTTHPLPTAHATAQAQAKAQVAASMAAKAGARRHVAARRAVWRQQRALVLASATAPRHGTRAGHRKRRAGHYNG